MTTDNRTNEPNQNETKSGQDFCFTEAQVEAAAKAHRKHGKGDEYAGIVCRECDEYFEDRAGFEAHRMRAALVAAAGPAPLTSVNHLVDADGCEAGTGMTGAAPQAEMPGRQELGQTIRNKFNEARGRSGVDPWALADLILEEHPALAAQVLPSSTVGEGARSLSAWPTVDEVRERFEKSADRIAFGRMIAEVERAAAIKAIEDASDEIELGDWSHHGNLSDRSNAEAEASTWLDKRAISLSARAAALGLTAGQEGGNDGAV